MVLEGFANSLRETIKRLSGATYVDKDTVKEVVKDIQRILLKADVNVKLALQLSKELEDKALNEKPPAGMAPQDYIVKLIYDELLGILGKESSLRINPQIIMLVGLYGQGKTTAAGKLAKFFMRKGLSVGLIAADVHRPAAYDQLQQLAKSVNASFYGEKGEKNPVKICKNGLKQLDSLQVKIVDTSGRDSLDEELLEEITELKKTVNPDESLFVIDASVGQQAGPQAKKINDAIGITGVILTKMDGTGKGGGALSAVAEIGAPIYFIGTGEHLDDMEIFNPKKFLSRLLGLGDLETLLEVAETAEMTEEEAEKSMTKLMSGKFNLMDMYEVWEKFSKPGLMRKMFDALPLARLPGTAKIDGDAVESAEDRLKSYRVILDSMTYKEMKDPDMIHAKRIERIAKGSGSKEENVRALLKEYKTMRKNLKNLQGNRNFKKLLKAQLKAGDLGLENL